MATKGKANMSEKPSFAQTCNRLSQFLKERGSFADILHGISSNPETSTGREESRRPATNCPSIENLSAETSSQQSEGKQTFEFFPQSVGFASPNPADDSKNKALDFRKVDPASCAQMTIFYGSQIMVFDDLPAEKAKEVIALATKFGTSNGSVNPTSISNNSKPFTGKVLQLRSQPDGSDLPIARRASLHRFFEKRKGKMTPEAHNQINNPSDQRIVIDLESHSPKQFDLNL